MNHQSDKFINSWYVYSDFTCEWDDSNSVNNEKTQYKGNTVVESFKNAEENVKELEII